MQRPSRLVLHNTLRQLHAVTGLRENALVHALNAQGVWGSVSYLVTLVLRGAEIGLYPLKPLCWFPSLFHVFDLLYIPTY